MSFFEPQGRLANVFIPANHQRYDSLCKWAKTANERWWKFGKSSDGQDGIWIPLNVWQDGQAAMKAIATVATMTPDQLREHYAKHGLSRMRKRRDTDDVEDVA